MVSIDVQGMSARLVFRGQCVLSTPLRFAECYAAMLSTCWGCVPLRLQCPLMSETHSGVISWLKSAQGLWCSCMLKLCLACRETLRKVERLHLWDVARANKSPFAFGIEPRVPFLDKAFLQTSMSIDPQDKMVGPPHTIPLLGLLCVTSKDWHWHG